ncbi:MAG: 6,7-dimethyl-8-ribityllumazine synthase [Pseudomonadota bacterium]
MKGQGDQSAPRTPLSAGVNEVTAAPAAKGPVAIVASRYNAEIMEGLIGGALAELAERGIEGDQVFLLRVPGAFEIPQAVAQLLTRPTGWTAVVTLGCVIRGETPHFDYVCRAAADGIGEIARRQSVPVTLGVLTTDTLDQAQARSADDADNKGREATRSALELAGLLAHLP